MEYGILILCDSCCFLLIMAAAQLITSNWKHGKVPSLAEWFVKIRHMFLLNKLTVVCKYRLGDLDALRRFRRQWRTFAHYYCAHALFIDMSQVLEAI